MRIANMENILYTKLASFYDLIADDRDFLHECSEIIHNYQVLNKNQQPRNILELFAGPAYHAQVFKEYYQMEAYAVDSSPQMKELACNKHHITEDKYITGFLPDVLSTQALQQKFDLILIMRYSLGLINYKGAYDLLTQLENYMTPGGLAVIELHDLNAFFNQFADLNIKTRQRYFPETKQTISCIWPSGPLTCDRESWNIEMPIQIDVIEDNGDKKSFKGISEEEIHTISEIERMILGTQLVLFRDKLEIIQNMSNTIILQRRGMNV